MDAPEPSELGLFVLVTKDVDIADSVSGVCEHQFVEEMISSSDPSFWII